MAVELASAYVSIIPTTKGLQGNLEKELSPLSGAAAKAGNDSGKALGSSFTGASGGLKSSLGDAEGHFGSFKSKATGALSSVGISTGVLAAGAGAAIIGFGISALNAFTGTAKAAVDMNAATGLSIENSSRWIAIGDDMGISAETLQGSIGKVAKSLDETKWADFGVATRDAGGQARDVNDILLDSFDKLGKITNETERAREGNLLFGKGYSSLAPLIGKTRAEMEDYLGSVEKGQVITAEEAATAEKARLAQDELSDAIGELGLAAGGLVARLAPVITAIAKAVGWAVDLADAYAAVTFATKDTTAETDAFAGSVDDQHVGMGNVIADFIQLTNVNFNAQSGIDKTAGFFDKLVGITSESDDNLRVFTNTFIDLAKTSPEAAGKVIDGFELLVKAADAGDKSAQATLDTYGLTGDKLIELRGIIGENVDASGKLILTDLEQKEAADAAAIALKEQADAADLLKQGEDNLVKAIIAEVTAEREAIRARQDAIGNTGDLQQSIRDVESGYYALQLQIEANNKTQDDRKVPDGDKLQSTRDLASATHQQASEVFALAQQYADESGAVEGSKTKNQQLINSLILSKAQYPELTTEINKYIAQLNLIPHDIYTNAHLNNPGGDLTGVYGAHASGGYTSTPWILAGEQGPELIQVPTRSYVHTAAATRSLMASVSQSTTETSTPPIVVNNNRRDIGVADLNHVLAMARLAS